MTFPGREAVVGDVLSLTLECVDCGRTRVRKPIDLRGFGVGPETSLSQLGARLTCKVCIDDGQPGRNISIHAHFVSERARLRAEAYLINSREARAKAQRAKRA